MVVDYAVAGVCAVTAGMKLSDLKKEALSPGDFWDAALAAEGDNAFDETQACYVEALKLYPRNALLLNGYAWFLLTAKAEKYHDAPKALELAKKAVALSDGDDGMILDTLALALFRTGDLEGAVKHQEKAVEVYGEEPDMVKRLKEFREAFSKKRASSRSEP